MGRRRLAVVAVVICLSAGCTSSSSGPEPPTAAATPPSAATTAFPSTSPSSAPLAAREPIALAFNVHRAPVRLSTRLARRVVAGQVARWSALDQVGGRIRLRTGPRALSAATRDPSVLAVVPASSLAPTVQTATVDGADPLRSPGRYPLRASAQHAPGTVTTMTIVGDIMLGRRVASASPNDPGAALDPLQKRLAGADLTLGNLESTLSTAGAPRQGTDSFAADPSVLDALQAAGFDLLTLANNHTGDFGPRALDQTLRRIDRSPLRRVGAGHNSREAWAPVILEHGGVRFGFLAFNAIGETPRATRSSGGAAEIRMQPRTGPLNRHDLDKMTRAVRALADRVDVTIVLPHWGDQYTNRPVADQRTVGRALIDAGADLVVGGHPHWVQGIQVHRGRLVVHSLGNFVFDMDFSLPTREGVMLELVFWDGRLMAATPTPYVIGADFAPRLARSTRAAAILDRMWQTSDPPFSR